MRIAKVSVTCIAICGTLGVPGVALAQDPGIHFDSGSPAGKEYAIPLAEGRAEGSGSTGGDGSQGANGGAKSSGAGGRGESRGGDGSGSKRPVVDEEAVSNADAPVDTTRRTVGIALGGLAAR